MPEPILIVYKGPTSQTGIATRREFPNIDSEWKEPELWEGKGFDDIKKTLMSDDLLAVLPMWNSHKGEISPSHVIELLFQQKIRLYSVWPAMIDFTCLTRLNEDEHDKIKTIISVDVAEAQCSQFIEELGAKFLPEDSTLDAYNKFKKDKNIDAVLCTSDQNIGEFEVVKDNAANPMNFTTFALTGNLGTIGWTPDEWGSLHQEITPKVGVYFGVQMPIRNVAFSDDQKALFGALTDEAITVNEIPRVLFVTSRTPGQCGLLIEGTELILHDDILTEDGFSTEIEVIQDIGEANKKYTEKIHSFLNNKFSSEFDHDFIRHKSIKNNTCFFACPKLEVLIHGFEEDVVEPVMRQVVDKYFELIDNGIGCTDVQRAFFEKHKDAYYEHGTDFIKFVDIGTMS